MLSLREGKLIPGFSLQPPASLFSLHIFFYHSSPFVFLHILALWKVPGEPGTKSKQATIQQDFNIAQIPNKCTVYICTYSLGKRVLSFDCMKRDQHFRTSYLLCLRIRKSESCFFINISLVAPCGLSGIMISITF